MPSISSISPRKMVFCWVVAISASTVKGLSNFGPAKVNCDAQYNMPCSRINSRYLAQRTVNSFMELQPTGSNVEDYLNSITNRQHNMGIGFYPFVFRKSDAVCLAHGTSPELVGKKLPQIFLELRIKYSSADSLHDRFVHASEFDDPWVYYLWREHGGEISSKVSFILNLTDDFYLGVGYHDKPPAPDLPCSSSFDRWCSINNVRSLVGKAQTKLSKVTQLEQFEEVLYQIRKDKTYQIDGGFYLFMYSYDGTLVSHPILEDYIGWKLPEIFQALKRTENPLLQHHDFVSAAEGLQSEFVRYKWRNHPDEPEHTKIAHIAKITFGTEHYYLGAGFEFSMGNFLHGPNGEPCSDLFNLPCSFQTALQMSSHAFAHAISSPLSENGMFREITEEASFKHAGFYLFFYDFNSTCVAHGGAPSFVGKNLTEIFQEINVPLDAELLHQRFRSAAAMGGGWVFYDWVLPGEKQNQFQKVSYIFQVNVNGREYYGGVGLNNVRFPLKPFIEGARGFQGVRVACTRKFGAPCSSTNVQAVLGQALSDLVVESEEREMVSNTSRRSFNDVLVGITQKEPAYHFNDFHVMVFSYDQSDCSVGDISDGAGCCVAHGGSDSFLRRSWQYILDTDNITSIRGNELHKELIEKADGGGGWFEFVFSREAGEAQTKRAWVSKFKYDGKRHYIVSDHFKTRVPPTCYDCPVGLGCTEKGQQFCTSIPLTLPSMTRSPIFIIFVLLVVFLCMLLHRMQHKMYHNKKKMRKEMEQMAQDMGSVMKRMVKIINNMPEHDVWTSQKAFTTLGTKLSDDGRTATISKGEWFWEEDASRVADHKPSMTLKGTNFVKFAPEVSEQIEHAFENWRNGTGIPSFVIDLANKIVSTPHGLKLHRNNTGMNYSLNFETEKQKNLKTGNERAIKRVSMNVDIDAEDRLQSLQLPDGINFDGSDGETLLPAKKGQIIQVSKEHEGGEWLFGSVLFDPLLNEAKRNPKELPSEGLNSILSDALNDRAMSGWFPQLIAETANVADMRRILDTVGIAGLDNFEPPSKWERDGSTGLYVEGLVYVSRRADEFEMVVKFLSRTLPSNYAVTEIQRVQNISLWQTYSVKKLTLVKRDSEFARVNNHGDVERKWLFHGTTAEASQKIVQQGFNRAFAGMNAVAFGRGVYFHRDASYSCKTTYSTKDSMGIQRMFLCRVALGDWCIGRTGQKIPNTRPGRGMELFDTTVDDVHRPNIFVTYHDSQSYPEYLVSFTET